MDKDPATELPESSPIKRFLHFIGLSKPDTVEELEQEIQELLEEGEEHGLISSDEGTMINSILDLKDTLIKEIMTPRTEMVYAPAEAPSETIVNLIRENGFSRIPVYSENPDHIIGIIHAKDLLICAGDTPQPLAREINNPAFFVLENENVATVLRKFQRRNAHMAIVVDEFGITRGLVTLEDVLEEIVGEIIDEYDREEPNLKAVDKDTVIADGKTRIEEIEEYFSITLPDGPYESIGGLITHQLGRVPQPGARLTVDRLQFTISLSTKRRVISAKIHRVSA